MVKFWYLFFALFVLNVVQSTQACSESGWFGSKCQYKCNCRYGSKCDAMTGECGTGSSCDNGWFGPACQYVDLTATERSTTSPTWLYDGDDSTCNNDETSIKVTVQLQKPFPFTWLRINVKDRDYLNAIQVQFKKDSNTRDDNIVDCINKRTDAVDKRSLDIHCDLNSLIQQVVLSGQGVKSLCSVYINGGRRVTLKQPTKQSSPSFSSDSSKANDGVLVNWYTTNNKDLCTNTSSGDNNPNWNLTFEHPPAVNRFLLNYLQEENRYITHHLTCYDKEDTSLFSEDRYEVKTVVKYEKTLVKPVAPVSVISVTAESAPPYYKPMMLCEVLGYGDTVCPQGKYGRECEHSCDNCLNQECFVATGGCILGCVDGFVGNQCQTPCSATYYGKDCGERCNTNCVDRLCDNIYGICNQCESGKMGDQCEKDCPPTKHGSNCELSCSTSCEDQLCHSVNGFCYDCPPGYSGFHCENQCPAKSYGRDCKETCSSNCEAQLCDPLDGTCDQCILGKTGEFCDQDCPPTKHGSNCELSCSTSCEDQLCHSASGFCFECPPGYFGVHCENQCPAKSYGRDCKETCSSNCEAQLCDPLDGTCDQCILGKTGEFCDQECPPTKYGSNCELSCSTSCEDQLCHSVNGFCNECPPGYFGFYCENPCESNTYGLDCAQECNTHCVRNETLASSTCHHVNGSCILGCNGEFSGPLCEAYGGGSASSSSSTGDIVGGVVGGVIVGGAIILLIVGFFIWRKMKKNREQPRRRSISSTGRSGVSGNNYTGTIDTLDMRNPSPGTSHCCSLDSNATVRSQVESQS